MHAKIFEWESWEVIILKPDSRGKSSRSQTTFIKIQIFQGNTRTLGNA
jgi:hypothetical protein